MNSPVVKTREYKYKKVSKGSTVGRLTVIREAGRSSNGSKLWECSCTCGNTKTVISSSLNSGLVQSCGCLLSEVQGKQTIKHGRTKTREYRSWLAMRQRCYYPNHQYYHLYGGRGISVCDRWKDSFENFYEDMGTCPKGFSLDRVDVEGDYTPDNCKWSSNSEQGYNTRKKASNTSGRSGVHYHNVTGKWAAVIGVRNKSIHLGVFDSFEAACEVREKAELHYYGFTKE